MWQGWGQKVDSGRVTRLDAWRAHLNLRALTLLLVFSFVYVPNIDILIVITIFDLKNFRDVGDQSLSRQIMQQGTYLIARGRANTLTKSIQDRPCESVLIIFANAHEEVRAVGGVSETPPKQSAE